MFLGSLAPPPTSPYVQAIASLFFPLSFAIARRDNVADRLSLNLRFDWSGQCGALPLPFPLANRNTLPAGDLLFKSLLYSLKSGRDILGRYRGPFFPSPFFPLSSRGEGVANSWAVLSSMFPTRSSLFPNRCSFFPFLEGPRGSIKPDSGSRWLFSLRMGSVRLLSPSDVT